MGGFLNAIASLDNQININNQSMASTYPQALSVVNNFGPYPSQVGLSPSTHINTGDNYGYHHFTFVLRSNFNQNQTIKKVTLNIDPEEFIIDEPFRVNPIQTMGGAFIDVWDVGIRRLTINGNTGWRTQQIKDQNMDGFTNLFTLKENIIEEYFSLRSTFSQSQSQASIEKNLSLVLIDTLHETTYDLVPETFRLYRNKQKPLLLLYNMSFIIIPPEQLNSILSSADSMAALLQPSVVGVATQMGNIKSKFDDIATVLNDIANPFGALESLANNGSSIAAFFQGILTAKNDIGQGVAEVAQLITSSMQAVNSGLGQLQSFSDLSGIEASVLLSIWNLKNAYSNLLCLLHQVMSAGLYTYTGIVDSASCSLVFGLPSSTLSSTRNSFEAITTQSANATSNAFANVVSNNAQTLSSSINSTDTALTLASA